MNAHDDRHQEMARRISTSIAKKIAMGIALLIAFLIFIAIGGVIVRLLWNWLMPEIFGIGEITYWQALGLLALSRILFGGFGHRGGPRGGPRRRRRAWWREHRPEERPSQGEQAHELE